MHKNDYISVQCVLNWNTSVTVHKQCKISSLPAPPPTLKVNCKLLSQYLYLSNNMASYPSRKKSSTLGKYGRRQHGNTKRSFERLGQILSMTCDATCALLASVNNVTWDHQAATRAHSLYKPFYMVAIQKQWPMETRRPYLLDASVCRQNRAFYNCWLLYLLQKQ